MTDTILRPPFPAMLVPARGYKLTTLDGVRPEPVRWLMPGRVPFGGVTVIAGAPGQGKSQVTLGIAASQSREGNGVILIGAEDGLADTVRPRLMAANADLSLIHAFDAHDQQQHEDMVMLPVDVPLLEEAVRDTGASTVVIDPFAAFLAPELNAMSDHSLRQATAPLAKMAQRTGCSVLVVAHFRKSREGTPLSWVSGSIGLTGQSRSVLILGKHKDYNPLTADERLLVHVKCNGARLAPTLVLEVAPRVLQDNGLTIPTSKINYLRDDATIHAGDIE